MPVYVIHDYYDGKYITFELDKPVRVRINHVRGKKESLKVVSFLINVYSRNI